MQTTKHPPPNIHHTQHILRIHHVPHTQRIPFQRDCIEIILYLAEDLKLFYSKGGVLHFSTGNNVFLRP